MKKNRILLELPQELKNYFDKTIFEVSFGMGFTPFLRSVLFFLSDIHPNVLQSIIKRGLQLEEYFKKSDYTLQNGQFSTNEPMQFSEATNSEVIVYEELARLQIGDEMFAKLTSDAEIEGLKAHKELQRELQERLGKEARKREKLEKRINNLEEREKDKS